MCSAFFENAFSSRIAGQCIAMEKVVMPAKLCLRSLCGLLYKKKSWEQPMILTEECARDLHWWYKNVEYWNCLFLSNQRIVLHMYTDSCDRSWGEGQHSFRPLLQSSGHVVQVMTDNSDAAANINHLGWPNPGLTDLTRALVGLRPQSQCNLHSFAPGYMSFLGCLPCKVLEVKIQSQESVQHKRRHRDYIQKSEFQV